MMNKANGYTVGVLVGVLLEGARALLVEYVGVNTVLEYIALIVIMVIMISVGRIIANKLCDICDQGQRMYETQDKRRIK